MLQYVEGSTNAFFERPVLELVGLSESEFLEHFKNTQILKI